VTEKDAYIVLNALPEVGPLRVAQLLQFFPGVMAILEARQEELLRVAGIGVKTARAITTWQEQVDAEREQELAARAGAFILTRVDEDYPPLLREIHDPPLCVYVRGNREVLRQSACSLAIVGSRRTSQYGVMMAEQLASAAALAGWTVVSGLARGIDTVAHQAVVRLRKRTVAVIGSGLGRIYPQENIELARSICQDGAVVSEFPMLYAPSKHAFPMRNRIIAGMTRGTIVVEAGHKSGSLITANQAADENRLVFAVPGRADSPQSRGCHALIKDGARLVETFQDVLDELTMLPGFTPLTRPHAGEPAVVSAGTGLPPLSDTEQQIMTALATDELGMDQLVHVTGLTAAEVLRTVFQLEMKRLVRQLPGKRVARAASFVAER
jgi:DNA processing protein